MQDRECGALAKHLGGTPNQALQRTAATVMVCQGVKFQRLPRPLSLGVRRGGGLH